MLQYLSSSSVKVQNLIGLKFVATILFLSLFKFCFLNFLLCVFNGSAVSNKLSNGAKVNA